MLRKKTNILNFFQQKENARINSNDATTITGPTKLPKSDIKRLDPPRAFFILVGEVRRTA